MNLDDLPPPELKWEGNFIRAFTRGKWEYASRARDIRAVVILAEHDGKVILVDQPRVGPDCRCVELPAGLVGDHDPDATDEGTAVKELEEETGFTDRRQAVAALGAVRLEAGHGASRRL
jgi:ADP-ribose pyrophosphatase